MKFSNDNVFLFMLKQLSIIAITGNNRNNLFKGISHPFKRVNSIVVKHPKSWTKYTLIAHKEMGREYNSIT